MSTAIDLPDQFDPRAKRLQELVDTLGAWSQQQGWDVRMWSVTLETQRLGTFEAPALEVFRDSRHLLLEPVARACAGTEGVVDLYLMPDRDDIGSFYLYDDEWHVQFIPLESSATQARRIRDAMPLDLAAWREILAEASHVGA